MNALLCLLSDQHVPNLLSVHHFRPDHLVLVESKDMQKRHIADNFLKALLAGGLSYDTRHNCNIYPLEAVSDFQTILQALKSIFSIHPTAHWTANLTGGTKPMSIAAYEFFKAIGARLIYVDVSKPSQIVDAQSGQIEIAGHRLAIREFLLGYGFDQLRSAKTIQNAEKRARSWWEASRTIACHQPDTDILLLPPDRKKRGRTKGIDIQPDEWASLADPVRRILTRVFPVLERSGGMVGKLEKYAVQFLTGGWLEAFVWNLVERHADALGIWDVRLGIEPASQGTEAPNDFDVSFMRDYALNMIECKSGDQAHDRDVNVLYKLEAAIRQFRALRVRSFLATTSDNIFDKEGCLKKSLADRAAIYGCRFLTRQNIKELAENFDDPTLLERIFFSRH